VKYEYLPLDECRPTLSDVVHVNPQITPVAKEYAVIHFRITRDVPHSNFNELAKLGHSPPSCLEKFT
jgi:hypothetical protein